MITERQFLITLTTLEPFRVGGKDDPVEGAENRVSKVGGKPAIPGSSLKGALRGEIEQHLIDTYYDTTKKVWQDGKKEFQPCIPSTKFSPDEQRLIDERKYRPRACHYPCDYDERHERGKCYPLKHSICPACYFLGAQGLFGFARIPFLFAEMPIEELYSLRFDRGSKTGASGSNRPYELLPPKTVFTGTMYVLMEDPILKWKLGSKRELRDHTLGDLWLARDYEDPQPLIEEFLINRLASIKILGGYKTKGFGKVEVKVAEVARVVQEQS